jgi:hypothetical protein
MRTSTRRIREECYLLRHGGAAGGAAGAGSWRRGGGAETLREVVARGKNPREHSYSAASLAEAKVYRNTPLGQVEAWPIRPTFRFSPKYYGPVQQL